jgi:PPOX class probable F420-dependent enzyme
MTPETNKLLDEHAQQRLHDAMIIWITTVRGDGQPQASPVGFLWDGNGFLIFSQPGSQKVRNLRANPRVALHLDSDGQGGDVLTLEGHATLDATPPSDDEAAAYLEKYREMIRALGTTPEAVQAEYSTVLRVTPIRVRAY